MLIDSIINLEQELFFKKKVVSSVKDEARWPPESAFIFMEINERASGK